MSGKAIFWLCLTAYYGILISVLAVRFVRSFLAKRGTEARTDERSGADEPCQLLALVLLKGGRT